MPYKYVVVAVDDTGAGRHVALTARTIAERAGARLGILTSLPARPAVGAGASRESRAALGELEDWLARSPDMTTGPVSVTCSLVRGVPGIEIPRFAEENDADLLVIGHTPRTPSVRKLVGDTADAVARRSRVPCLLVPPGGNLDGPVLAALDGTRHSPAILDAAGRLAGALHVPLHAVTVEDHRPDEPRQLAGMVPLARTIKLDELLAAASREWKAEIPLHVRHGAPVDELLAAVREDGAQVLAVGFHRGGPPGVMDGGSIARRLVHAAPATILTVPI
ncbi:MAG TPA: universal stress protein [Gemmatimonadales bacterium]|jgi:nucleotide-binding universal stress UspA family protein|nr:universal stress protein [Gemmatimonadales bacterium]